MTGKNFDEFLEKNKVDTTELKIENVAKESRLYQGKWSRGVKVGEKWYNVYGEPSQIDLLFNPDLLARGNTIKAVVGDNNTLNNISLVEKGKDEEMINLDVLLKSAHEKGLVAIETELVYVDYKEKTAVFKAIVRMKDSTIFTGFGDADQVNTAEYVREHYIRMAETRAICRALRWATNNASPTKEEMK